MPDQSQRTPIGWQQDRHGYPNPTSIVWEAKQRDEPYPRLVCLASGEIYAGDGATPPTSLFGSALGQQGPKGDPGDPGPKGDTGDPGANGLNGSPGAPGAAGAAGAAGVDGRTILSGTGVPGGGVGVNGDFYIRNPTTAPVLYGPKTGGAWGSGISMVGPQGPIGATGPQGPPGTGGSVDLSALTARVALLEQLGFYNVEAAVNVVGNDSTDCTVGLQSIISYFGGFNVPIRLRFNGVGGRVYRHTGLDIAHSSIYLEGVGRDACVLNYRGSGAKTAVHWHGTDEGDYSGRLEHGGALQMTFTNNGSQDSIAFAIDNATDMLFDHIRFEGYRGKGSCIKGRNWADSDMMEIAADFCGGIADTDLDWALFDLSGEADGEWACDRLRWWGGRIENCAGRIFDCRAANGHFVAKILLVGTKIESSVLGSNGFGGSEIQGAAFYLSQVLGFEYLAAEITLQGKRDEIAYLIPRMFHLDSCYGVTIQGQISMGAVDDEPKVFDSIFDVVGGSGFTFDVKFSNGDDTGVSLPNRLFKFTGGVTNVYRDGTMWVFDASGFAAFASVDSGTFTNTLMINDTLASARQLFSGARVVTASGNVLATDAGATIVVNSATEVDLTLLANTIPMNTAFRVVSIGAGGVNVLTSGGAAIEIPASASLTLRQFESLTLWRRSGNTFDIVASNFGPGDRVKTTTAATGTVDLDWYDGDVFRLVLTGNVTLTMSHLAAATKTIIFVQGGVSGNYTVTWPATVKWPGGTPPTIDVGGVGHDTVISLFYDGFALRGNFVGNEYA